MNFDAMFAKDIITIHSVLRYLKIKSLCSASHLAVWAMFVACVMFFWVTISLWISDGNNK